MESVIFPDPLSSLSSESLDSLSKLVPKKQRFVAEYLVDLNGSQAAIRAGYSPKGSNVTGSQLLADPIIQQAITELHNANIQKACISAQRVLLELSRLCTSNPRNLFDENGKLIPIKALPNEVAATVSSIEVVQKGGAHIQCHQCGARQEVRERVVKVKQWDKNVALTNMAKHFGLLRDLMEVTGKNGGPIQIETSQIPLEKLSIEGRRQMLEILEREQLAIGQGGDDSVNGNGIDNVNDSDTVDAEYVESGDRNKSGNERLTATMPLYYSPEEE